MDCRLLQFKIHGDDRGKLVALEGESDIPFMIKRVFYMYDTMSISERGKHANTISKQVIICLSGACSVVVDDGENRRVVRLNTCDKGLYVGPNLWREINKFSEGNVVMILTDTYYDKNEYITDYEVFLREGKKNGG